MCCCCPQTQPPPTTALPSTPPPPKVASLEDDAAGCKGADARAAPTAAAMAATAASVAAANGSYPLPGDGGQLDTSSLREASPAPGEDRAGGATGGATDGDAPIREQRAARLEDQRQRRRQEAEPRARPGPPPRAGGVPPPPPKTPPPPLRNSSFTASPPWPPPLSSSPLSSYTCAPPSAEPDGSGGSVPPTLPPHLRLPSMRAGVTTGCSTAPSGPRGSGLGFVRVDHLFIALPHTGVCVVGVVRRVRGGKRVTALVYLPEDLE